MSLSNVFQRSHTAYRNQTSIIYYNGILEERYTFDELKQAADGCKNMMVQLSTEACNEFVAIVSDDTYPHILAMMIGLMDSGNAFVFMDTSKPKLDILFKLKTNWLISDACEQSIRFSDFSFEPYAGFVVFKKRFYVWNRSTYSSNKIRFVDKFAFGIMTSGSTGAPKVIRVLHKSIEPNVHQLRKIYDLTCDDVVYVPTPLTFDPAVLDIFVAFSAGASVLLCSKSQRYPVPDRIFSKDHGATVMYTTPSLFLKWFPRVGECSLRILALGGEPFPRLDASWAILQRVRLFNLYGVTEVSCWAMICEVQRDGDVRLLGQTLDETTIEVRDDNEYVIENGVGELFVGSNTRKCILEDDVIFNNDQDMLFRSTGDLVELKNKSFYYIGRKDRIVKLYGNRVDLGAVENTISEFEGVKRCYCLFEEDLQKIIGFVELHREKIDDKNLNVLTASVFKSYAVPFEIIPMHSIPISEHGKLDKFECRRLYKDIKKETVDFEKLWKRYTGNSSVNPILGFMQSGGTSLNAFEFISDCPKSAKEMISYLLSDRSYELCKRIFEKHGSFSGTTIEKETMAELKDHRKSVNEIKNNILEPRQTIEPESDIVLLKNESSVSSKRHRTESHSSTISSTEPETTNWMKNQYFESHEDEISSIDVKKKRKTSTSDIDKKKHKFNSSELGKLVAVKCRAGYSDNNVGFEFGPLKLNCTWEYYMEKCVDATPLLLTYSSFTTLVVCGSHSGLLVIIDVETKSLIAKYRFPDRIEFSACASDCGRYVFFGCHNSFVYCFSILEGSIRWSKQVPDVVRSNPISRNGYYYFGCLGGWLCCMSQEDGSMKWRCSVGSSIVFEVTPFGDGTLATMRNGTTVLVDADGRAVREYVVGECVFSNPCVFTSDGFFTIVDVQGALHFFDIDSGQRVRTVKYAPHVFSHTCHVGWNLYFGCHDAHVYCVTIDHSHSANLAWRTPLNGAVHATPFLFTLDRAFIAAATTCGSIYILDAIDGRVMARHDRQAHVFSSPVVSGCKLLAGCRDDMLCCYDITTDAVT